MHNYEIQSWWITDRTIEPKRKKNGIWREEKTNDERTEKETPNNNNEIRASAQEHVHNATGSR